MAKVKAIPVTGLGGLWGCEILRIPHFLENWLTNAMKLSVLHTGCALPPERSSDTHFC
jgi:hypothetical protein